MGLKARHARRLRVLVLVVASSACLAACGQADGPGALGTHIAADPGGSIAEWVIFLPEEDRPVFLPTQAHLITSAEPRSRFCVAYASDASRKDFQRALRRFGFDGWDRIRWLRVGSGLSPWARDQLVMGEDAAGEPLFFLHHPEHYQHLRATRGIADTGTPEAVRRLSGARGVATSSRLEGGCVVADDRMAFLAADHLLPAVRSGDATSLEEARLTLERLYGRPIELLPSPSIRPSAHSDLHLTPCGGGRVVLGDPRWGRRLLERMPAREREVFDARVRAMAQGSPEGNPLRVLLQRSLTVEILEDMDHDALGASFDAIERHLVARGYEVVRVPWLATHLHLRGAVAPVLSWNNVVLESQAERRIVYLPVYGLGLLDEAAAGVWTRLGYEVRRVPALGPALHGGALRCLTQTRRERSKADGRTSRPLPMPMPARGI